ncbi:shikimate dehydrogenase family protein [Nakamurella sp.]|uniref:shikimate dehydrogenase family protein n=1 Tax=Nakamurella sp. TaxID=1869182 RepID=UPI003B3BC475
MIRFRSADRPTFYFIGVSTGSSSIRRVFPAWARHLGLDATLTGIDLALDDDPANYRAVVSGIKNDPHSLGALVTTHKLNLYRAAADLFDQVGPDTETLGEVSSISKRDGGRTLYGDAKDPITCALALDAVVGAGHWSRTGADLLLLGAGGSSLALTLALHRRAQAGEEVPGRIVVSNRRAGRLAEMRQIHERIGFAVPIEYHLAPAPADNDALVAARPAGSVIANATGLGKDRPGSPLTDAVRFPDGARAWDFNYRGDLVFLDQARAQEGTVGVIAIDGWFYFLHGWTRVIAEVFADRLPTGIPTAGPEFDELSRIALAATAAPAH